ncbi:bifunctional aminoglycoside phosphotransferase/ATP-binding protein [Burkholderia pseudomallei]|uniref:bifunctional aminoglycoside phosphotransferase/ATP-binding protein n=1 Tax=Burkholderia pseudomallei TaxID=28450 RepID=UPI000572221E|nr:bifunctional aminoglycoside phosphotransferase/ATP-binding protein [Burkholderia pseudomallei]ONC90250.1 aminoglycoside phosphotransferase [Burkholderia pseudomallei]ONC99442.1 aminoglycoside phosphotransferase [Burkholderia pseudomallei]OND05785.1 aminoglycoside phosphotransferase [Burkholderia pseudomallei]OND12471.1 aminoglycoside phosphotransferase [Burkholderia pseudomallei]OND18408.1 aminoglycoside phosphotransferase [Burkholderia pseudomallei]
MTTGAVAARRLPRRGTARGRRAPSRAFTIHGGDEMRRSRPPKPAKPAAVRRRPHGAARAHAIRGNGPQRRAVRERAARRLSRDIDAALRRASTYPHPAGPIVRIETHLSVVYLVGRFAYKRLKPFDFGFANFSELAARRRACEAELALNRPLAAPIYLAAGPLVRRARGLRLFGAGAAVDHVVRMRRFDERMLFSRLLARGALDAADIDAAATRLAAYHLHAPRDIPRRAYGSARELRRQLDDMLAPLERALGAALPASLRAWCVRRCDELAAHLDARRADGYVRACHGDLHLNNVVKRGRDALMFDCIDFDDALRWIDVINDLSFLLMDLHAHERAALAYRLLNRWLDETGDFAGLAALPLYVAYRALVRALVATMRAGGDAAARAARIERARRYVDVAAHAARARRPCLLLCHGYSGSGKSVASRALADVSGAIRLSSDSERKRARPFAAVDARPLPASVYTPQQIDAQYERLRALARDVLRAGYTALVDATFLSHARRARFFALARELGVPVYVLDFHASRACLERRVDARAAARDDRSDAGAAVLATQRASADPLDADERARTIGFDTDVPLATLRSAGYWRPVLDALDAARVDAQATR